MALITLTTDWHNDDFYKGSVKGVILSHCPNAQIIDISHQVTTFNTTEAIFILKHCYHYYPKGTIHILDVNSECSDEIKFIAFAYKGYYFIGTNSGYFGLLFEDDNPETIVAIEKYNSENNKTFPSISVFGPAAAYLALGNKIEELGTLLPSINKQISLHPTINEAVIAGSVIYIDSYQNAITNISEDLFKRIGKGRPFEILVQSYHYKINKINQTYNETVEGELLALFNSAGLLEIAINKGNVAELLNIGLHANIRVKFSD